MNVAFGDDDFAQQKDRIARAVHSAKETRRTGLDDIIENAKSEAKMYPLPIPTRLEKQYLEAARQRHKVGHQGFAQFL